MQSNVKSKQQFLLPASNLIHSGNFYSASSSPLYYSEALPTQQGCCVGVSSRSATDNCEWRTCTRSLRCGQGRPSPQRQWCISLCLRFSLYFWKIFRVLVTFSEFYLFLENFFFYPPKFLMTCLVIHSKFATSLYSIKLIHFPLFRKRIIFYFPLLF